MSRRQSKRSKSGSPPVQRRRKRRPRPEPGKQAASGPFKLRSFDIGALPLVNHILDRMGLEDLLEEHLPPDDPRTELPTSQAILVLVRNILLSREPIYGVGEWAARFPPDLTFREWRLEFQVDFTGFSAAAKPGFHDDSFDVQQWGKCPTRSARGWLGSYGKSI